MGLDQTVLRAEQLVQAYQPDTIIVSFIAHDVHRTQMSFYSGRAKPYFDIEAGALRLHPAPVPVRPLMKRILSQSMFLYMLLEEYLQTLADSVHHRGGEVACLLMQRLASLGGTSHARVIVVAQPQVPIEAPDNVQVKDNVLTCARNNHLEVLDLFPAIEREQEPSRFYVHSGQQFGHMNREGNRFVATMVSSALSGRSGK